MNILVTGGAGFIGSNFVRHIIEYYPSYKVVNLDLLTYAGNIKNLDDLIYHPNHHFVHGNITNRELLFHLIDQHNITAIINFAAESHVDRSITNSKVFVETNILGTLSLLDVAKDKKINKFIQVSTDEVYGCLGGDGYFTEKTPLQPNNPYSASKASADLLVLSYYKTHNLNVNITRSSNNYGPHQFPEKLIPLMITNALDGLQLPVYGDGKNIRDWLHVKDHCRAIALILHGGEKGEVYNIGSCNERTNNQIVQFIVEELGISKDLITYIEDRLGHDYRYAIDPTKLEKTLGWNPDYTFDIGIIETIEWYKNNQAWWRTLK